MFGYGETVEHHKATTTVSPIGQTRTSLAPPVPLAGCGFAPESTKEPRDGTQIRVVSTAKLYVPAGTQVGPNDEFTVRGVRYAVEGDPGQWTNPFTGWSPGAEIMLRRVADA